jgi:hypothetical protein
MSGRHPLDKLFGAKLERRAFPEEQGEFDEVRALIDLQNAAHATRGGVAHWAWWSLLAIPAALLIWWGAHVDAGPPTALTGTPLATDGMPALLSGVTAVAPPVNEAVGTALGDGYARSAAANTTSTYRGNTSAYASTGSSRSTPTAHAWSANVRSGQELDLRGNDMADDEPFAAHAERTDGIAPVKDGAIGYLSTIAPDADECSAILHATARAPITAIIEPDAYRKRALGDIHFVGTLLRSNADDLAAGPSSVFGIEYRVRKQALSLATGMHYGSYGLNGSGASGSDRVRLEYLQIPLLVGYEVGLRRFGLLVQGGVSCDFFFSASGRYGPLVENSAATIEDESFRTVNVQAILRPQVFYRATERIGIFAGPTWTRQLSSVAVTGPLAEARTTSTGAAFGLIWKLERSTY